MNRISTVIAIALLASPSVAAADYTNYVVGSTGASIASGVTFTTIDVVKQPESKLYGGIELGVNSALAASQFYLAATISVERDESNSINYVAAGLGVWNLALAVHGGYVLMREEKARALGLALRVGGARGLVVPTTVSDGHAVGAGALFSGSF